MVIFIIIKLEILKSLCIPNANRLSEMLCELLEIFLSDYNIVYNK